MALTSKRVSIASMRRILTALIGSLVWKHSVIKRSDGDDYTIWVHNSFKEDTGVNATDDSGIQKRLLKTVNKFILWRHPIGTGRSCDFYTYNDDTGPNAPFTGGIQTMRDWAGRTWGHWEINYPSRANGFWISLLIAGSNSGFNAVFQASPAQARRAHLDEKVGASIGSQEISLLARETNNRYARKIGNSWRARAWGHMWCWPDENTQMPPDSLTYWRITNTAESIGKNPNGRR